MTAREYLHQMKTLKYQIRVKRLELKNLHEDMDAIRSPTFGDKIQNSSKKHRFEDQIIKAMSLEEDIKVRTAQKIDCLHDIHAKINGLDDELSVALLTDRYINNRSSDEVSKDVNYTPTYVRRLTGEALEKFVKKYGDDF